MKRPDLSEKLLAEMAPLVEKLGFHFDARQKCFLRERDVKDFIDYFGFIFVKQGTGFCAHARVMVRSRSMDRIFHEISGVKAKEQSEYFAVAFVVWDVFDKKTSFTNELLSEDDVVPAAKKFAKVLQKTAIPFFDEYSSIAGLDRLYNSNPPIPNYFLYLRDFWVRTAFAAIAAKLSGNKRYGELIKHYKQMIDDSDVTWHAGQFDELVKLLAKVKPQK